MKIRQEKLDPLPMQKILSYMIMDRDVLDAASRRYRAGELKSSYFSTYHQRFFQWLVRYYEKTNRAPEFGIKDIWEVKKKTIPRSETRALMEQSLIDLADAHAYFEDDGINHKDVILFDLPNFIREQALKDRMDKAHDLMEKGDFEKAAKVIQDFHDVDDDEIEDENMGVIMPFTKKDVVEHKDTQSGGDIVYQFDGDLGRVVGPLRKSWLVAITGTEKAGKSFLLDEIGYDAVMYHGRKVLKINLELSEPLQRSRMQKRISLTCDTHQEGKIVYPVLDCENNQFGTCRIRRQMRQMKRRGYTLLEDPSAIASFVDHKNWSTCTDCHNNPRVRANAHFNKRFIPTIWFDQSRVKSYHTRIAKHVLKQFREVTLANFRVRCFPRFSKTFEEIRSWMMRYIDKHKWMPDIILLDYIDIMGNSGKSSDDNMRHEVDRKWKQASQLAGELNCLVINADQATKAGREAYQLDQMSTSESKTKDAHLDVRIALNQTKEEKPLGISRIGVLFHRHMEFAISNEILVTQRLATSQPILENTRVWGGKKIYRVSQEKSTN